MLSCGPAPLPPPALAVLYMYFMVPFDRDTAGRAGPPTNHIGQGKVPPFAPCNRPTDTRTPTVPFALHVSSSAPSFTTHDPPPSSFHLHPQPSWSTAGVRGLWAHALRRAGHGLDSWYVTTGPACPQAGSPWNLRTQPYNRCPSQPATRHHAPATTRRHAVCVTQAANLVARRCSL